MLDKKYINVGKIIGVFGVKGWVKIFSYTDPRGNVVDYSPWILKKNDITRQVDVIDGNVQGKTIVALVSGVSDRDAAAELIGWEILIDQEQLPEAEQGEFYWSDLIGLKVETTKDEALGVVESLLETGANDVIIVKGDRERVIPFLQGQTIIKVDLEAGEIVVDWDPDF